MFHAENDAAEEVNRMAHVESPAKDLNKQCAMAVAHPAIAAPPTSDDEKLKILLAVLQNIDSHALQILDSAAQNASQKLECETYEQIEGEPSKQGVAVKNRQAASGAAHLEKPFALIP